MNGITIFTHSVRQVLGNIGMAIRISWWLVAAFIAAMVGLSLMASDWFDYAAEATRTGVAPGPLPDGGALVIVYMFAVILFLIWGSIVVAIAWHRFILNEEKPTGLIPYRSDFRVGGYFLYTLGIALLVLVLTIPLGIVAGLVIAPFSGASIPVFLTVGAIVGIIIGIIITVVYLRMALVLPAVALDSRLGLGDAWSASRGASGAIAVLAVALVLLSFVVNYVLELMIGAGMSTIVVTVLSSAFQWFNLILNISILSTLYGHLVQKRDVF